MKLSTEFWNRVETHIDKCLSNLGMKPFNELCVLKEGENLGLEHIEAKEVLFGAFTGTLDSTNVIVVVQAAVKGSISTWNSLEKGIVVSMDGQTRQASKKEVDSVL